MPRAAAPFLAALLPRAAAQPPTYPDSPTVDGPQTPQEQPAWLQGLAADRNATLASIGWAGGVFDVPELRWTQTAYVQPQMHPYDRYFYDAAAGNYTVQRWLGDLQERYGGIDAALIWPTYTNIGADDRNQYDLFRAMPGGLDGVARVTKELKAAGVRVLWPYNPWDIGTRREDPDSDEETLARLLQQTGGDGFNGDTMWEIPRSFWDAAERRGYPIALEPEDGGTDASLNWATMAWGYWYYPVVPVVDRLKFVTGGKFLTNLCGRWEKDKTDMLQFAWFNGDGIESWENVWGTWNGIVPRDGEALRRVAAMLRYFGKEGFLQSPLWEPHATDVVQNLTYASRWPLPAKGATLWTVVNRGGVNSSAPQLTIPPPDEKRWYYDCYHGEELTPVLVRPDAQQLSFWLEAGGYGCVVEVSAPASGALAAFLATMSTMTRRALGSYSTEWRYLPQTMVPIPPTQPAPAAPAGTVLVRKGNFSFSVTGVEIEGTDGYGVDVQYPWEDSPRKEHSRRMEVGPFFMDKFPVTCANYSGYLADTGYRPKDPYNWIKNWGGQRTPPDALADVPVTYVSLREAREYCRWRGARLPHSWEWQYAAQGVDGRAYPWGDDPPGDAQRRNQTRCPELVASNTFPGPEPVARYTPAGDSPFGVSDVVGNVWQYTDEFADEHTRAVVLRGGSNYRPAGSSWYFPQALELHTHNKYFLMDDSYERAGTIGFRCVVDAAPQPAAYACSNGRCVPSPFGAPHADCLATCTEPTLYLCDNGECVADASGVPGDVCKIACT